MTTFGFKEQLRIGERGEQEFMEHYPLELTKHEGREGDFVLPDGRKLELKTDTYCMSKTGNFFIERYSNLSKKSPGSLWQALGHGCSLWCYYFQRNSTYFEVQDIPRAIELIEGWLEDAKPGMVLIPNRGYQTGGYKVPREVLEEVYDEYSW